MSFPQSESAYREIDLADFVAGLKLRVVDTNAIAAGDKTAFAEWADLVTALSAAITPATSLPFPYAAPASPTAFDDEFTAGSLNAQWTAVTAPSAPFVVSFGVYGTFLCLQGPGGASSTYIIRETLTGNIAHGSTLFSCTIGLSVAAFAQYAGIGLELCTNTSRSVGSVRGIACELASGIPQIYTYHLATGARTTDTTTALTTGQGGVYLHLQRSAGNVLDCYWSNDCKSWRRVDHVTGLSTDFDYLMLNMYGSANNTESSREMVDFVRVNWITLTQS